MARTRTEKCRSSLRLLFYGVAAEPTPEDRSIALIVATLIAAVTFQAGVSPPGGVWQENSGRGNERQIAGQAVYATNKQAFYVFLIFNTLALSSSILKIIILTYGFPYYFEVVVATTSMVVTYGSAIFAVTPHDIDKKYKFRYLLLAAACPFLLRLVVFVANKSGFFGRTNRVVSSSPRMPVSSTD